MENVFSHLNVWSRGKTKPEGPYIKCFVIFLDFPLNNHINKDGVRATTAQLYPDRDTFGFDEGHVTKNQTITCTVEPRFNEVARDRPNLFVKWRVRYIENLDIRI